ncbi:YifB family Mg chelatase-like AAA ATPase [Glycomyces arizonensis]|uniref:YifB family Mg chelatase-like AAA ATPase n=1 Tax=Glycomyces arizonensis TaxID=256035 RepID=UPI0004217E11|nr:ATP-binding protein [Glycomyces arizonensis]
MGDSRTTTIGMLGTAGTVLTVEASFAAPASDHDRQVRVSGLADNIANQIQVRVRAAMANSALHFPHQSVTITISPAAHGLTGSAADLAVAVAIMSATGMVPAGRLTNAVLLAELGLDGSLRVVPGAFPAVTAARKAGFGTAIVAPDNAAEAALVAGMTVLAPSNLSGLAAWLHGQTELEPARRNPGTPAHPLPDFADLHARPRERRVLEVAAAGGHHLFLVGPPAAAKTALAERLPSILPPLSEAETVEVTALHSLRGRLIGGSTELIGHAPFEAPHHSMTAQALIGGGHSGGPGSLALAHRGVLFIDEAPEWRRHVLDTLLRPLERGEVLVRNANSTVRWPARCLLVLASTPCPCAPSPGTECRCSAGERRRYLGRLARPLLDRIDLHCEVDASSGVAQADWLELQSARSAAARVRRAREIAAARWRLTGESWRLNSDVPGQALRSARWRLPAKATKTADGLLRWERITVRGYDRILSIAWTLADLRAQAQPTSDDVDAAVELRLGYPIH